MPVSQDAIYSSTSLRDVVSKIEIGSRKTSRCSEHFRKAISQFDRDHPASAVRSPTLTVKVR